VLDESEPEDFDGQHWSEPPPECIELLIDEDESEGQH
jgi:hypothetical protein